MKARTSGPAEAGLTSASQTGPDLVGRVLAWGVPRMRDLPWRQSRDPWGILVAEVMAQQTQVDRVVQRWGQFLDRFPTPAACAAAPLGDVLREWHGLGYPRRARHLHESANRVVERLTASRAQQLADSLCPPEDSWVWNQVIMDLGAVLCRPSPRCGDCPIQQQCVWASAAHPDPDPAVGSAGVSSKQARFEGSDRQARGRLMARLVLGAISAGDAAAVMQVGAERAARLVTALVSEGLVERTPADVLHLP